MLMRRPSEMAADVQDIRGVLAQAAAYGVAPRRGQQVRTPQDALRFVHAQIDGTILPRRLTFFLDDAPMCSCDVAGGRLLAFDCGPLGRVVPEETGDDAAMAAFRNAVEQAATTGKTLSVAPDTLSVDAGRAPGGVPATQLRSAFGLAPPSGRPTPEDALAAFVAAAGDTITAAAYLKDDMLYPLMEDSPALDALVDAVETLLGDFDDPENPLSGLMHHGALMCLSRPQAAPRIIAVAVLGQCRLVAFARDDAIAVLVALWSALDLPA